MNPEDVKKKLQEGLSIFCATCTKYWKARENGIPGDTCLAKKGCASPIGGGTFEEYEGPINPPQSVCFVCGTQPDIGIATKGSFRVLAVCNKHRPLLDRLAPTTGEKGIFTADKAPDKKPQTLAEILNAGPD